MQSAVLNQTKTSFNSCIHGLRGFAALSVVLLHIWMGAIEGHFLPNYIPNFLEKSLISLQSGVHLFFMISGYLIPFSIVKNKSISRFLKNRCIRLYPVYLPTLLLIFILGPFAGYDYFQNITLDKWLYLFISNFLFLPGVFPMEPALIVAWTLSYEAALYLFCALSYFLYSKWPSQWASVVIILGIALACYVLPESIFFAIGAAVYYFYNGLEILKPIIKKFTLFYLLIFYAGMLALILHPLGTFDLNLYEYVGISIFTLLSGFLLFAGVAKKVGTFSTILNKGIFQFLGSISYSLYIWHTPIMFGTKRLSIKFLSDYGDSYVLLSFAISSLLLSFPVAYVSYLIFEKYIPQRLQERKNINVH